MKKLFLSIFLLLTGILPVDAAARFLVACTAACTWDASNTAIWSTTSGGGGGSSVPGSADTVTLDAATCVGGLTCTITVNTTVNVVSITMGACTATTAGCILDFSANNNNVTIQNFSGTGTGTRTLNMGNGTWTDTMVTSPGTAWDFATTTNLTFNANSSTLLMTGSPATAATFNGGGRTYNIVTFGSSTTASITMSGANTFATFNVLGKVLAKLPGGQTQTITNAIAWGGTSTDQIGVVSTDGGGSAATVHLSAAGNTITWAAIYGLTFNTNAVSATNSFDLGRNTMNGGTITPPTVGSARIIGG